MIGADEWIEGTPPHVGWWEATSTESTGIWRWWNGERWSVGAVESYALEDVVLCANATTELTGIKYRTTWPENARVPRLTP